MTKSLLKNTFREIKNTKARFISILAIIALGVGFLSGIKSTVPSMYALAEKYYSEQNLMDYRLVSTVGFDEDDIKAVSKTEGVSCVMPSYYCDVLTSAESGGAAVRLIAVPEEYNGNSEMNKLVVKTGRLPEKENEIVLDHSAISDKSFKIGDKITFAPIAGKNDITESLTSLEYTIVGTVDSPLYISYQRGNTDIGNGKLSKYMYIPSDNFAYERYTELYVRANFSENCEAFSDDYSKNSKKMAEILEETANSRCEVFKTDVIEDAQKELDNARAEFKDEKAKAEKELEDAQKQIDDGRKTLAEELEKAQTELDNAKSQIESGRAELETAKDEYYSQIFSAENTLAEKEAELEKGVEEYNNSVEFFESEIATAQQQIDDGYAEYNAQYEDFKNNAEPQLLAGIQQAQTAVDNLTYAISVETNEEMIAVLNAQLSETQLNLDNLNAQYTQATQGFEQSKAELDLAQSQLDEKRTQGKAELDLAGQQLIEGQKQLEAGKAELEAQKTQGYNQLLAAEAELDSAQAQYNDGVAELEKQSTDGKKKLDDAQAEYDEKKAEADEKLADAEKEIEDAQEEIDNLENPKWYVFDRDDNPGYSAYTENVGKVDAVATVFPVFFLLVAVLVCVTTMTRLIEEKRTEIATLKALGYSNLSIVMKFVIYALIAGVTGCLVGTALGVSTLPFIIYNAYRIMYYLGDISLVIHTQSVVLGVLASIICTTAVSVFVCVKSLRNKPAQAMRPKAPKAGKRILLEYITPLWKRMGFTSKLTARNLFRYKSRLFMTSLGVAGCTALILAAFGLLNSFVPLTNDQFETIYKYNAAVVPEEKGTTEELKWLVDDVESIDGVDESMLAVQEELKVQFGKKIKETDTYLTVVQAPENLNSIISLHKRSDKSEYSLTDDGVLISEKMSKELGVKDGDTIKLSSESGDVEVRVCGVFEQYIQNYVYMTPSLYEQLYNKTAEYNVLMVKFEENTALTDDEFSSKCLEDDRVTAVSFIDSIITELEDMLESLNLVVFVMVICAAALAFVVLYNLTNINIAERVREIATFKVLGFKNNETSSFIYRENIVLTLIGIAAGLVIGYFLASFVVVTIEVDSVMFGREVFLSSYLYAAGLTMLFSLLVNAVMSFKIKAVNMVESLKSVE